MPGRRFKLQQVPQRRNKISILGVKLVHSWEKIANAGRLHQEVPHLYEINKIAPVGIYHHRVNVSRNNHKQDFIIFAYLV